MNFPDMVGFIYSVPPKTLSILLLVITAIVSILLTSSGWIIYGMFWKRTQVRLASVGKIRILEERIALREEELEKEKKRSELYRVSLKAVRASLEMSLGVETDAGAENAE